jgi:hypothetical protein
MMARISLGSDETPQLYKQLCIRIRLFQGMEAFVNTILRKRSLQKKAINSLKYNLMKSTNKTKHDSVTTFENEKQSSRDLYVCDRKTRLRQNCKIQNLYKSKQAKQNNTNENIKSKLNVISYLPL